jgi:hypothetical protein
LDANREQITTLYDGQVRFIYVLRSKFSVLNRVVLLLLELDRLIYGWPNLY